MKVLLGFVAVVAVFLAVYTTVKSPLSTAQTVGSIVQVVEPLVTVATPAPSPTMSVPDIRLAPSVMKQIQGMARLETQSMTIEKAIEMTRDDAIILGIHDVERVQLNARATVVAGVDLAKIMKSDIQVSKDGTTVSIRLPAGELFSVIPDETTMVPTLHTTSLFGKQLDAFVQVVRQKALSELRITAINARICDQASTEAEARITTLMESVGFTHITVTSTSGSCE